MYFNVSDNQHLSKYSVGVGLDNIKGWGPQPVAVFRLKALKARCTCTVSGVISR